MADIKDWSKIASNNNAPPPDGAPEGMLPSTVNNVIRENMAAVRAWYEDAAWMSYGHSGTQTSEITFTLPTDVTDLYTTHRAIRIQDTTMLYGFVVSSAYTEPNTTVTVALYSGTLTPSMNGQTVSLGVIKPDQAALPKNYQYGLHQYAEATSSDNAYTITVSPPPMTYETGMIFHFKVNQANTGPATLNVNEIGAVALNQQDGTPLEANDLKAHQIVSVIYSGSDFQRMSSSPQAGGLSTVVEDTAPQLGGDLVVNGHAVVSTENGDIHITPHGTGHVSLGNYRFDTDQTVDSDQDQAVLTYDHNSGAIHLAEAGQSGQGAQLLHAETLSGQATIDLNQFDKTLYGAYRVIIAYYVPQTNHTALYLRTSSDGGATYDATSGDYEWQTFYMLNGNLGNGGASTSDDAIDLTGQGFQCGNQSKETLSCFIDIPDPSQLTRTHFSFTTLGLEGSGSANTQAWGHGVRDADLSVNAIQLSPSSGTMQSGTVYFIGFPTS